MTGEKSWVEQQLEDPLFRRELDMERASFEFVEQLDHLLEMQNLSRSDLARRLGKTSAHVTQSLRRGRNLTIKTMVEIADAVSHEVHVRLRQRAAGVGPLFTVPMEVTESGPVWLESCSSEAPAPSGTGASWLTYANSMVFAYESEDTPVPTLFDWENAGRLAGDKCCRKDF